MLGARVFRVDTGGWLYLELHKGADEGMVLRLTNGKGRVLLERPCTASDPLNTPVSKLIEEVFECEG